MGCYACHCVRQYKTSGTICVGSGNLLWLLVLHVKARTVGILRQAYMTYIRHL